MYSTGAFQGDENLKTTDLFNCAAYIYIVTVPNIKKLFYLAFHNLTVLLCLKVILFFYKDLKFDFLS